MKLWAVVVKLLEQLNVTDCWTDGVSELPARNKL
jgi:hypothetical protein